jgi:Metallopeptidase family M24/Creatinase/Prolidase N-terminal domain
MDELAAKRSRLLTWMANRGLEAVYLTRVSNFAWLTGGLEPVVMLSSDRSEAGLLVTPERSYVVCNSIEHVRLRDEDRLEDQGYAFHVSPWQEGTPEFSSLLRGTRWAADWPLPGSLDATAEIARLRFELFPEEVDRFRRLGQSTAGALERAARQVRPGMSEMEVAGRIAAEAMREGVTPTLLLVGADERVFRFRHPIPTPRTVASYAMLVICGRRWGLVASATRLVHFGPLNAELQAKQKACAFVDATFNLSTVVGAAVSDVFAKGAEAYREVGFPEEWRLHNQGGAAGYESRDYEGTPACRETVLAEQGFAWNPSITGMKSEDTILVHPDGVEFLTATGDWPTVSVTVGGQKLDRPAILIC